MTAQHDDERARIREAIDRLLAGHTGFGRPHGQQAVGRCGPPCGRPGQFPLNGW